MGEQLSNSIPEQSPRESNGGADATMINAILRHRAIVQESSLLRATTISERIVSFLGHAG